MGQDLCFVLTKSLCYSDSVYLHCCFINEDNKNQSSIETIFYQLKTANLGLHVYVW